ncbi:F0F1 ATP synthase subunit C [Halocatena salina]
MELQLTAAFLNAMVLQAGESAAAIPPATGAAIGFGLAAIGAGYAERSIGSAAVGAIAEDRGMLGYGVLLTVIPETIVIFGLVVVFLLQ